MTGESRGLRLDALGRIGDGPVIIVRAVLNDKVQLRLRDGDGRGREAEDLRLGHGRRGGGIGAGHLFALGRDRFDGILRAGHQRIEGHRLARRIGLARLVAVGVGAGDVKRAGLLVRFDGDGHIVRADLGYGNAAHMRDGRNDDKEPHRRADDRQCGHADGRGQEPLRCALLFLPALAARRKIDLQLIVIRIAAFARFLVLRFGGVLRVIVQTDGVFARLVAVHLVNDGVEQLRIGREILLEVVRHLLGVGKLDGLHLFLGVRVDLLRLALDGRDDECVGGFVALAVVEQGLLHFLRRLIAVLRLERAGLEDDLRHLIVGVHGRRQRLAGHAQLVRGARGGLFVLKRAVVAVIDAVEDHADGIDIGRRLDAAEQAEQLRRGIGAEHVLGHGAVFQLVDLRDTEIAQQIMPLTA